MKTATLLRMMLVLPVLALIAAPFVSGSARAPAVQQDQDATPKQEAADEESDEYFELFRLFADTLDQVERNYVQPVDRRELIEAAIDGMLSKLDQHSDFIPPAELEEFRSSVESEFGGIGIQVSIEEGKLTVISPIHGSPAYEAGIMAGDVVTSINGTSTEGISLQDSVKLMKGEIGTPVDVAIRRGEQAEELHFQIRRAIVQMKTVLGDKRKQDGTWSYLLDEEDKIGYIRVASFGRRTSRELKGALRELSEQGTRGLVLDLRFNPGGLLSAAIQSCDLFLDEGKIVSTQGRNAQPQTWHARKNGTTKQIPLVILVNQYSASASEIVSACLQDHQRAVVVGDRTFGKGSVQNIIQLEEGQSALKLTTAGYIRPSGLNIHRFKGATPEDDWGVKPNEGFEVKMNTEEIADYLRYRRDRDVIRSSPQPSEQTFDDRPLVKAVDYLKGKLNPSNLEGERDGSSAP